ncbi:MAG TPA: glutamyl-tRNA reductase [Alphaproteobacteria bacterium]|nr:glutamyl-tRNA reductase [Alphaproteobacteria bacterium]
MPESFSPSGRPLVVGANHRSSSMALRDRLFVEEYALPGFYDRLREAGINQALVLSTCDRIEVQTVRPQNEDSGIAAGRIVETMAGHAEIAVADLEGQIYTLDGAEAVRQIFTVPSSLDSLVVGEPQVLGQVKAGHRLAREMRMIGPQLESLLQAAYAAAKRVRSETAIGERPVSIAAAAVEVARDLHGDLGRAVGLLVGGGGIGDMGDVVAGEFIAAGLGALTVIHPLKAHAAATARALDCHRAPWPALGSDLDRLLGEADVVLAALGRRRRSVSADGIKKAIVIRCRKPMFIVDLAVPGDVEPAVDGIEDAFLYTLDDLERVAMRGRQTRKHVAGDAWEIIDEEVAAYIQGQASLGAVPVLSDLRRHFDDTRAAVLNVAGGDAEKATRLLVSRLLHGPTLAMRERAADSGECGEWAQTERLLRRLFGLKNDDKEGK